MMFKSAVLCSAALAVLSSTVYSATVNIHDIQGDSNASPLVNQTVTASGIVTAVFPGLYGFYIQESDVNQDGNPSTSEGLFVYQRSNSVAVGDSVEITGTIKEYYNNTQLSASNTTVISSGNALPAATELHFPLTSRDDLEAYEGMLVTFPQTMTVSDNYNLGRYGEMWISANGRMMNPTSVAAPGAPALAVQAVNDLNKILLDDNSTKQNPDPVVYPSPELSAENTIRAGNEINNLTGIIHYSYSQYRVMPTDTVMFEKENDRDENVPSVGGTLKVASFNVLNYFNGDGLGGGFPTSRGADNADELVRQSAKIVSALNEIDADIVGLMEIENDGYDENSAIAQLVRELNSASPFTYDYVNPGVAQIGTDEIAVGFIYKTETVRLADSTVILTEEIDSRFNTDKNRPALAQAFEQISNGEKLVVAVNHFKSKGSDCDELNDLDKGDLQGNCNITRTLAAEALADWLNSDPTGSGDEDVLIIGDLNAYAMEDPITVLSDAGYTDMVHAYDTAAYSYVYYGQAGYLDHALANVSLETQISGVAIWHINADEPRVLDYNKEYKSADQIANYYDESAFRSSDHDPVLVGLYLSSDNDTTGDTTVVDFNYQAGNWTVDHNIQIVDRDGSAVAFANVKAVIVRGKKRQKVSGVADHNGWVAFTENCLGKDLPLSKRRARQVKLVLTSVNGEQLKQNR